MFEMETNSKFFYLELSFQTVRPFGIISDFRDLSHGVNVNVKIFGKISS
jgi:hypothetical protein